MNVTIVGAGVLGTMHAWMARERGHRVLHLDRDVEARSASVRNFGLIWVSGRADGDELVLAWRARERWGEIGVQVPGVGFRPHGSLTVALTEADQRVMAEFAASPRAAARDIHLLDPDEVRALNPAVAGAIAGALHCPADAIVEPRSLLPALRAALAARGGYRFEGGVEIVDLAGTTVVDQHGRRHDADAVVVCPGAAHGGVASRWLGAAPLRRRRLQMMQTAPFDGELTTSVADADSLRYYPAYAECDLGGLGPQDEVAAAYGVQLLLVQRRDGGLTIGDTHDDEEPFPFDVDEAPYDHLRTRAEAILGRPLPPVQRRWSGVYSQQCAHATGVYHHEEVAEGVVVVTGLGGRGMTLSPAIAERTWEAWS